jgi:hypothetical protein
MTAPTERHDQTQLSIVSNYKVATDVAHVCRDIVLNTVVEIDGKRYVKIEGWNALAVAHGCIASIKSVTKVEDGFIAVAVLKRQSDLAELASAEGFIGHDEPDWFGGTVTRWNKKQNREMTWTLPKRPEYAIRAMVQTRATSRVLRLGFSHVIALIDHKLATVPAEEIGREDDERGDNDHDRRTDSAPAGKAAAGGKEKELKNVTPPAGAAVQGAAKAPEVPRDDVIALRDQFRGGKWKSVVIHFSKNKDSTLGELETKQLRWYVDDWQLRQFGERPIQQEDLLMRAACDVAGEEEEEALSKVRK